MENNSEVTVVTESEQPIHPFFEKNDIAVLSMLIPMLSPRAQKLISFFLSFGTNDVCNPLGNIGNILGQLSQNSGNLNSTMMTMAPMFMELLSKNNKDAQAASSINPMLISSLLNAFVSAKPSENK